MTTQLKATRQTKVCKCGWCDRFMPDLRLEHEHVCNHICNECVSQWAPDHNFAADSWPAK